jgi:hypothetical protein
MRHFIYAEEARLFDSYRLAHFALFRRAARAMEHQGVEIEICETWRVVGG